MRRRSWLKGFWIAGRSPEQRLAERKTRSTPRLARLKALLEGTLDRISSKAGLAGAIRYATARWDALTLYAADGRHSTRGAFRLTMLPSELANPPQPSALSNKSNKPLLMDSPRPQLSGRRCRALSFLRARVTVPVNEPGVLAN
jgi:hypothetical protein